MHDRNRSPSTVTAPIRVLHVFVTLPVGGAEFVLLNTVQNLPADRFQSVICCIRDKGTVGEILADRGYPLFELGLMHKKGWDWRIVQRLAALMRQQRIDLVHCHLYHANLYGRLAARRAGVPAIITLHNTQSEFNKWTRRLPGRLLAGRTAGFIAISEAVRDYIIDNLGAAVAPRVHVIANGVNLARLESTLSRERAGRDLGLDPALPVLGAVGRLARVKGHHHILEAMANLASGDRPTQLILIGTGEEEPSLRRLAERLHLAGRVHLLGMRQDVGDLLRAMDLFIMPSLWEGLSMAMLEAMGAGLPVIASDVGAAARLLDGDRCGLLVPAQDPEALTAAIRRLLDQPELARKMGDHGRRRVRDHYSDVEMVRQVRSVYEAVRTGERR